jgi:hypothetical protein
VDIVAKESGVIVCGINRIAIIPMIAAIPEIPYRVMIKYFIQIRYLILCYDFHVENHNF